MKICNALFCLLLCGATLSAQPPPPASEAAEPFDFSFSVFPLETGEWGGLYYAPKGDPNQEAVELVFNPQERSAVLPYKAEMPLRFFRKIPVAEGNPFFQPVAQLQVAPGKQTHDLILFCQPGKKNGPIELHAMVDSPETFPPDSLVFYNTLNIPLVGVLGETRFLLNQGASAPIPVAKLANQEVPVALALHDEGELHLVVRNQMRFAKDRRTIVILRRPKRAGSTRILTQRLTEYSGPRTSEAPPEENE